MKKILVMMAFVAASATYSFATSPAVGPIFYKLNNNTVFNGLMKYLDADDQQIESLRYVFKLTEYKMKYAERKNDEKSMEKSLYFNLGNAKYILSHTQYKKYLTMLNLSLYDENSIEAITAENNR
ncbi:MAG: hypothetical protein ACK5L7_03325 [Paludibacteraceae bacterium]